MVLSVFSILGHKFVPIGEALRLYVKNSYRRISGGIPSVLICWAFSPHFPQIALVMCVNLLCRRTFFIKISLILKAYCDGAPCIRSLCEDDSDT